MFFDSSPFSIRSTNSSHLSPTSLPHEKQRIGIPKAIIPQYSGLPLVYSSILGNWEARNLKSFVVSTFQNQASGISTRFYLVLTGYHIQNPQSLVIRNPSMIWDIFTRRLHIQGRRRVLPRMTNLFFHLK